MKVIFIKKILILSYNYLNEKFILLYMRLLSIIFIIFLLFLNTVKAQLPVTAGVKMGFNSSKMITEITNVSDIVDQTKIGYLAGVYFRINIHKFYIQPEIYYCQKGGDMQYITTTPSHYSVFTQQSILNTIDVPLLFGLKLLDIKVANLRLMLGPVFSYATNKNIDYQINGINKNIVQISTTEYTPSADNIKNTNWGLQAGIGLDVLRFTFDVKYEWGLNNISNNPFMNAKPRMLNVSLGMILF